MHRAEELPAGKRDEPTRFLQNKFVHDAIFGIPKVPVGAVREETDFMLQGSLTRWGDLPTSGKITFAGIAFSSGSLYHEIDGQLGIHRWSPLAMIQELAAFPSKQMA